MEGFRLPGSQKEKKEEVIWKGWYIGKSARLESESPRKGRVGSTPTPSAVTMWRNWQTHKPVFPVGHEGTVAEPPPV